MFQSAPRFSREANGVTREGRLSSMRFQSAPRFSREANPGAVGVAPGLTGFNPRLASAARRTALR